MSCQIAEHRLPSLLGAGVMPSRPCYPNVSPLPRPHFDPRLSEIAATRIREHQQPFQPHRPGVDRWGTASESERRLQLQQAKEQGKLLTQVTRGLGAPRPEPGGRLVML